MIESSDVCSLIKKMRGEQVLSCCYTGFKSEKAMGRMSLQAGSRDCWFSVRSFFWFASETDIRLIGEKLLKSVEEEI